MKCNFFLFRLLFGGRGGQNKCIMRQLKCVFIIVLYACLCLRTFFVPISTVVICFTSRKHKIKIEKKGLALLVADHPPLNSATDTNKSPYVMVTIFFLIFGYIDNIRRGLIIGPCQASEFFFCFT